MKSNGFAAYTFSSEYPSVMCFTSYRPLMPIIAVHRLRVAEREGGGVIGAEAGSGGDRRTGCVARLGERQHFLVGIRVVLQVPPGAGAGMQVLAVPALVVHLVQEIQLDPAVLEVLGEDLRHPPVGPLAPRAHGRGKDDDAGTGMSPHVDMHLAAELRAVPVMVLVKHGLRSPEETEAPRGSDRPTGIRGGRRPLPRHSAGCHRDDSRGQ